MSSELVTLLRQQSKIGPINVPRAAMRDAAARIEALEAEVVRKNTEISRLNRSLMGAVAFAAPAMRRDREGGNDV